MCLRPHYGSYRHRFLPMAKEGHANRKVQGRDHHVPVSARAISRGNRCESKVRHRRLSLGEFLEWRWEALDHGCGKLRIMLARGHMRRLGLLASGGGAILTSAQQRTLTRLTSPLSPDYHC